MWNVNDGSRYCRDKSKQQTCNHVMSKKKSCESVSRVSSLEMVFRKVHFTAVPR
jgi:hypothetical protein